MKNIKREEFFYAKVSDGNVLKVFRNEFHTRKHSYDELIKAIKILWPEASKDDIVSKLFHSAGTIESLVDEALKNPFGNGHYGDLTADVNDKHKTKILLELYDIEKVTKKSLDEAYCVHNVTVMTEYFFRDPRNKKLYLILLDISE